MAGALSATSYTLTVSAAEAGGATATVSVTVTPVPAVTVVFGSATYTTTEGAASGVTVTVTLSADPKREVMIPLTVTLQDGAEAADYSGVPASVTIASGSTSGTFVVSAVDDTVDDDGESIELGFGTALPVGVTVAATDGAVTTTTITLADNDTTSLPAVTVAFGSATYATTEGAASGVTVTVSLSADPQREVTIPLTVTLQDGAEAADYSGVPASVTIASDATSATFAVTAVDDAVDDDGESIQLGFGTALPVGVTVAAAADAVTTTTISLTDNDDVPAVTVAFGAATYTTSEGAASGVTVTVSLSANPEREVTIPLTVTLQGEAEAADYTGVPGSVTIASGATSATFAVTAVDDAVDDDGESIVLGFGDLPTQVTAGGVATTTVSLADNDETSSTSSGTTVWSATLTVGATGSSLGYASAGSSAGGALSDTSFDWQGASYAVWNLSYASDGRLDFILYTRASNASLAGLTLHLGDVALAVADAQVFGGPQLVWNDITLDWAADDTVTVRLTAPASDTSSGS